MRQRDRSEQPIKGRRANRPKTRTTATPSIADLQKQVGVLTRELRDAREHQAATADVLKIISRSSVELETVLDTLVETVARLCRADQAYMYRRQGDMYRLIAARGLSGEAKEFVLTHPFASGRGTATGRAVLERRPVHIPDVLEDPEYTYWEGQKIAGFRSMLGIPLLREDTLAGIFSIARTHVEPFTDKEIELATTFADQALIAIENVRLFDEVQKKTRDLEESLQQQTATADVLKVISRSAFDLDTVTTAILRSAMELCNAPTGLLHLRDDDVFRLKLALGHNQETVAFNLAVPIPLHDALHRRGPVHPGDYGHYEDMWNDPAYRFKKAVKMAGVRAGVVVPMFREDEVIGLFSLARPDPGPFTPSHIKLVQTFADQAAIAIENVRLFNEVQQRTNDLSESLEQQTATADVLKIISRSSTDLETVLETLTDTVVRLCHADQATLFRQQGDTHHLIASHGWSEEAKAFVRTYPLTADRGALTGRVAIERFPVQIPDALRDPEYKQHELQKILGYRSMLGVPLLREDTLIGTFSITRTRLAPFTDKEIELAASFADQAVIAIENARLFEELRERQVELRVTFDNMGDGVVMFDAAGRLTAWNRNFQELIELPESFLAGRPTRAEYFRYLADRGEFGSADLEAQLGRTVDDTEIEMRYERTRPDGRIIEVRRNPVPGGGFVLIYSDITKRKRAEEAIRAARDAAEKALRELQKTQASLVHAQKMAALGQLTAGIAHEIKNPLNFVNNFAGLSVELLEELKEATAEAIGPHESGKRAEIFDTIKMLTGNLERIGEHGRRADGIVRGMLQHSRGSSGDWRVTDVNALIEESANLAYHGARAQDQDFKIALELDLDRNLAPIEVVSQDLNRVLLNLISNGFYAVSKRGREGSTFRPTLKIATRDFGGGVEIRVRDNGVGIALEDRERLFQPFFTTKPTGEGTGLGLSISYEIVTQQHGGSITVDSQVDDFTEFTVRLPRRLRAATGKAG